MPALIETIFQGSRGRVRRVAGQRDVTMQSYSPHWRGMCWSCSSGPAPHNTTRTSTLSQLASQAWRSCILKVWPEQVEPVEPAEPVEPVKPTKPMEPVEPVKPTKPMEPVEPVEPTEPVEIVEPVEVWSLRLWLQFPYSDKKRSTLATGRKHWREALITS